MTLEKQAVQHLYTVTRLGGRMRACRVELALGKKYRVRPLLDHLGLQTVSVKDCHGHYSRILDAECAAVRLRIVDAKHLPAVKRAEAVHSELARIHRDAMKEAVAQLSAANAP